MVISKRHPNDPKGLIFESYRIDNISAPECRSIFLDWALSLPDQTQISDAIREMLALYAQGQDEHPMTGVLREGLAQAKTPKRRGGPRARHRAPMPSSE